jgi:hypothetical protein
MVPSATNKTRYHGLSQYHTNEQSGFTAENGYIPESKNSVDTHKTMNLPSTTQMSKVKILLVQTSMTKTILKIGT